jgi:ABC-2 type transport system ATP-binding protein
MKPAIITVNNLVFDYPNKRALHDVSIAVPSGAVLAMVGPNGAGKSTLMRVIAGLDEPVGGTVLVDGVNVLDEPRLAHKKLGYLSDFFGLYDDLTVKQCLTHAASIRAVPPEKLAQAVQHTAHQLGLGNRLGEAAGSLSRGLKQRLAIGQALIHEPKVLLLDEPAAGLDPEARASLSGLFRQLQAQGMTLLVSSHILAELEEYSTHMLAIRDGRVASFTALQDAQHGGSASAGGAPPPQRIRVVFTQVFEQLLSVLQENSAIKLEVAAQASNLPMIWLEVQGGTAGAARLLSALVGAGASIAEFAVQRETLQDSYLRTVAEAASKQQSQTDKAGAKHV